MRVLICTTPIRPVPTDYPPLGAMAVLQSLQAAGASIKQVAMSSLFPTSQAASDLIRQTRFDFYDKTRPPASTLLLSPPVLVPVSAAPLLLLLLAVLATPVVASPLEPVALAPEVELADEVGAASVVPPGSPPPVLAAPLVVVPSLSLALPAPPPPHPADSNTTTTIPGPNRMPLSGRPRAAAVNSRVRALDSPAPLAKSHDRARVPARPGDRRTVPRRLGRHDRRFAGPSLRAL